MHSYRIVCALVAATICLASMAQNNTSSPYSRYGLGEMRDPGFGRSQAMGGISYGLRDKNSINPANPASYSAIDSLTFLFDLGASGLVSSLTDNSGNKTSRNGNLDNLAMEFPLGKFIGASIGLMPYSTVGYNYSISGSTSFPQLTDTLNYTQSYIGSGGISQVYGGFAVNLFKHLSLGVNVSYLFGSLDYARALTASDISNTNVTFHSTTESVAIHVSSVNVRLGAQYTATFGNKQAVTIGAMFEPKMNLHGSYDMLLLGLDSTINQPTSNFFQTPMQYGGGFTYTYDNRLTVGADWLFQQWAKAAFYGQTGVLNNRTKLSCGGEYIDNPFGQTYLQRMSFRAGFNYSNSYVNINGYAPPTMAFTCGFGFPLRSTKSLINTTFEYGITGSASATSIRDNYFRFTLNLALDEMWFFKRKL